MNRYGFSCDNGYMNYYDELISRIEGLISQNEIEEALRLIDNELSLPYVPRDAEEKLNSLLDQIRECRSSRNALTMEQIEEYLFLDDFHQLMAVSSLDDKNLRNCIDLCKGYLRSDGNEYAKAYLIISLILQQIDTEMILRRKGKDLPFNPSKLILPEQSQGYEKCISILRDCFMKDPSKLKLAEELLYKEAVLSLPHILNEEEGEYLAKRITDYIVKAFQ